MATTNKNTDLTGVVENILEQASAQGRGMLFEHEVYAILARLGFNVPAHTLITDVAQISPDLLARYSSSKLVLKAVAAGLAHKQKAGAVRVVIKDLDFVKYAFSQMQHALEKTGQPPRGILVVEFVDYSQDLGNEILLGFKESDAFGPVISFSKGGSDAEHFARNFSSPNLILAPIDRKWAEALLYSTKIQEKYKEQGHTDYTDKIIEAGLRFSDLSIRFSNFVQADTRFVIKAFEVNPFVFDPYGRFIALDGYAEFEPRGAKALLAQAPPAETLTSVFDPHGVAVVGVSAHNLQAPGAIIAGNLIALGRKDIYCVNPKGSQITLAGRTVPVYSDMESIPAPVELAVVAVRAEVVLPVVEACARKGVKALILIAGGFSETGRGEHLEEAILDLARDHGMRIIGPNCLGVVHAGDQGRPGINTFFIPEDKLHLPPGPNKQVVLISQSGAFGLTELHNLRHGISPYAIVSYGNQLDIDPSDLMAYFGRNPAVDVIGCYIEGFKAGAGARFYQEARVCPKPVIVYKAGRTRAGRKATESHTASIAGEYAVAKAAMKQAGLVVAETVLEHKDLIKTFALFSDLEVTGNHVAIVANAGYEKTYAADHLGHLEVAAFDPDTVNALTQILPSYVGIDPLLDLTPMADDRLFELCIDRVLSCPGVDALFVSIAPQTPSLKTTDEEMAANPENVAARIVRQFHKHRKPLAVSICITAGADVVYNRLGAALERSGVPTFLSASQAMVCLNAFIRYRMMRAGPGDYTEWLK